LLAKALKRPENFVGMHFFNPVHMMPLVEVVRGSRSSDAAVSTAVGYAVAMGKTPIVVRDCPGFLVNRVLTAYMRGFLLLVADGADFVQVDRTMEAFGWPMGPAYLEDVVGMDTGSHVSDVISAGYPERMPHIEHDALRLMAREGRYGQKNGIGFYRYETDAQGKPRRSPAPDTPALLARLQPHGPRAFTDAEIVDRMMLPMVVEAVHALEEGVVGTAAELDTALQLGLGFPAYAGGPLQYADWLGLAEVVARCDRLAPTLGAALQPTARMRAMAARGERFHTA
ncbi:MAG: 3-hydroxyacyl-CoA dehydrogenase family protein, partial [Hydrogenophaga sp.]|nr:3-hydroxyacyl-CoA dehydrogenase family protein [Hydrogenophaga sp.]